MPMQDPGFLMPVQDPDSLMPMQDPGSQMPMHGPGTHLGRALGAHLGSLLFGAHAGPFGAHLGTFWALGPVWGGARWLILAYFGP